MRSGFLAISLALTAGLPTAAARAASAEYHKGDCDAAGQGEGRGEVDVLSCLDAAAARQAERLRRLDARSRSAADRRAQRQWRHYVALQCAPATLDVTDRGPTYRNQALLECRAMLTSDRASYLAGRTDEP